MILSFTINFVYAKHSTLLSLLLLSSFLLSAQNQLTLVQFSSGYNSPLGIENCGDSRLFIVQQGGQVMISDSAGNKRSTPYLDISDRISLGSERGLLGLAFDPGYLINGYFYVNYTNTSGNTQISRFKVSSSNPNRAVKSSEKFILQVQQPFSNHNGGCIRFGPDGYLYIGMGDGGSAGDPNNNAQNPMSLLGKMLRIDVHHGDPYSIPPDNPFVDSANYRHEIWALGLRNPWRWSFDAFNGALIIADVGQDTWEEVDFQSPNSKGGENYGWRCYEGNHAYNTIGCKAQSNYKFPVFEYQHGTGDCSITGGFVYRGNKYPRMYGKYFCADYCSGIIRMLYMSGGSAGETDVYHGDNYAYTSFGEDRNHELYVNNLSSGIIYHVTDASGSPQTISKPAAVVSVAPNPSNGSFTIKFKADSEEEYTLDFYNSMSAEVYTSKHVFRAGTNTWNISIPPNVKGNCYFTLSAASGKFVTQKILIQ